MFRTTIAEALKKHCVAYRHETTLWTHAVRFAKSHMESAIAYQGLYTIKQKWHGIPRLHDYIAKIAKEERARMLADIINLVD